MASELLPRSGSQLSRQQLAQFLRTPELIRAFEDLGSDAVVITPANEEIIISLARLALALAGQALATAESSQAEDAIPLPGPRGADGRDGALMVLFEDGEPGEPGPPGPPGPGISGATAAGIALFTAANATSQRSILGLGIGDTPTFNGLNVTTTINADELFVSNLDADSASATTAVFANLDVTALLRLIGVGADFTDGITSRGRVRWGLGFSSRHTIFLEALTAITDVQLRAKAGSGQIRFVDDAGAEFFSVDFVNNRINCYAPIVKKVYTVATLPTPSGVVPPGSCAFVSDALLPTFGSAVVGGGAAYTPVYVDGAGTWRVG